MVSNKNLWDYDPDDIEEKDIPIRDMIIYCENNIVLKINMFPSFYKYIGEDLLKGCVRCKEFSGFNNMCCYKWRNYRYTGCDVHDELKTSILTVINDIGCNNKNFSVDLVVGAGELKPYIFSMTDDWDYDDEITHGIYIIQNYKGDNKWSLSVMKKVFAK